MHRCRGRRPKNPELGARGRLMPAAALNENFPGDVTQSVAPTQLRHEYALPKTDRWDDETGSERPDASLKGPLFCRVLPCFKSSG